MPRDDNAALVMHAHSAARKWLHTVGLPTEPSTIALLARAITPRAYGSSREILALPDPDSPEEAVVVALLRAGQVPTHRSVLTMVDRAETRKLATKDAAAEDIKISADRWHEQIDAFGAVLSASVEKYWLDNGYGPLRSEAFAAEVVIAFSEANNLARPTNFQLRSILCAELHRAGWLVSNRTRRSLCAGPTYFASLRKKSKRRNVQKIGQQVGQSIGQFRFRYHRSPTWSQLASFAKDERDHRIFGSGADAQAQSRWLLTQGWIRIENGEIRRGARAKADTARRSADRQKNWEQKQLEREAPLQNPLR